MKSLSQKQKLRDRQYCDLKYRRKKYINVSATTSFKPYHDHEKTYFSADSFCRRAALSLSAFSWTGLKADVTNGTLSEIDAVTDSTENVPWRNDKLQNDCAIPNASRGGITGDVVFETVLDAEAGQYEIVVAVDASDKSDGVADEVFVLQLEEAPVSERSFFLANATVVYNAYQVIISSPDSTTIFELALPFSEAKLDSLLAADGSGAGSLSFPDVIGAPATPSYVHEYTGYGLAHNSGGFAFPAGYQTSTSTRRLPSTLLEQLRAPREASSCGTGGPGAGSCSITCGSRSYSVSCRSSHYACCSCGWSGGSARCVGSGGGSEVPGEGG